MDRNSIIKNNIYKIRRSKGISQECLATNLNISINSYRKLERGNTALINKRIEELATLLGVDIDDLLLNTNERDNSNEVIQTKELLTKENRIKELEDHIKKLNQCIDLLNDKIGYYSKSK